ncbi:MAG: lysophospholipid acyltransferase family protein [Deinococcota bacterium]
METITKWVQGKWFFDLAVFVFRLFTRIVYGFHVHGKDNVPKEGGFVLAANHISSFDPPVIGVAAPREVRFMAKKELFENNRYLRALVLGLRAFPVDRNKSDMGAIKFSLRSLKEGVGVGIFVQGTRHRQDDGAHQGAAFIAQRGDVPLIPTAIWREGRAFHVRFGEPMTALGKGKDELAQTTQHLMTNIQALLPSSSLNSVN